MPHACSAECAGFSTADEDLPLNCPGCKATIAEGTAICPACDYIIDTSFLSSDPPEADEATPPPSSERTNVGPAPTAPPERQAPRRTASSARNAAKAAPSRPAQRSPRAAEAEDSVEESGDEPERPRTRSRADVPRSPSRPVARAAPREEEPELPEEPRTNPGAGEEDEAPEDWRDDGAEERFAADKSANDVFKPEESLDGIKEFIAQLHTSDKLTFVGVVGVLISCVLPWKEHVRDGDSMGFVTLGVVAAIAAGVALGALVVRVRGQLPTLSPVFPWLLQLGATGFGTLWCLIFMRIAYDGRQVPALVGSGMVSVSTPSSGAVFGLLFMILALGGTLMGLREKQG